MEERGESRSAPDDGDARNKRYYMLEDVRRRGWGGGGRGGGGEGLSWLTHRCSRLESLMVVRSRADVYSELVGSDQRPNGKHTPLQGRPPSVQPIEATAYPWDDYFWRTGRAARADLHSGHTPWALCRTATNTDPNTVLSGCKPRHDPELN